METNVRDAVPCLDVFKKQAKRLTVALAEKTQISHGQSLEILAKTCGFRSWGEMKALKDTPEIRLPSVTSEADSEENVQIGFFLEDLLPYLDNDWKGLTSLVMNLDRRKNLGIIVGEDEYVMGELSKKFGHQRVQKAMSQMMSERSEKRRFDPPDLADVDQLSSLSLEGRPISLLDASSAVMADHILCATTKLDRALPYLLKNKYSINPRMVMRTVHHGLFQPLFWNVSFDPNLEFVNPVTALNKHLLYIETIKPLSYRTLIILKLSDLMFHNRFDFGGTAILAKLRSHNIKTLVLMDRKLSTEEMRLVMQVFGSVIE